MFGAGHASAAPAARLVYLRGKGAESCPDENAIKQAVAARLGYDPFVPYATAVMIAEVTRDGGAYKARIKLVDENNIVRGTRELTHNGDKCADMIDTMALTMSIAIDPESLTGPKTAPSEQPVDPDPPPEAPATPVAPIAPDAPKPTPPPTPPPKSPANAPGRLAIDVGLGPLGFVGAAPVANVGAAVFARARWDRASITIEGRADVPARRELAGAKVETAITWGSIAPCAHAGWAFACALLSVGSIRATSSGIRAPRTDAALHAAAGVRLGAEFPAAARLRVFVNTTVLATLTPQVIRLDGQDVYELPRLSAGLSAGVVLSIF